MTPSAGRKREFSGGLIALENEKMRLTFDGRAGRLLGIVHKSSARDFITHKSRVDNFRLRLADGTAIDGRDQDVRSVEEGRPSGGGAGHELRFRFGPLRAPGGEADIAVLVTASLGPASAEAILRIQIENRTACAIVESVEFPIVSGLSRFGKDATSLLTPAGGGERIADPLENHVPEMACRYPADAMAWCDLHSHSEGLYLASYDPKFRITDLRGRRDTDGGERSLSLFAVTYPWCRPKETSVSQDFAIAAHDGDWHSGADIYRAAANKWFKLPKSDARVRDCSGIADPCVRDQRGRTLVGYDRLALLGRAAKSDLGIDLLHVSGWQFDGIDTYSPQNFPIEELGGAARLKKEFLALRQANVLVGARADTHLANVSTAHFHGAARARCVVDRGGAVRRIEAGLFEFGVVCPGAPGRVDGVLDTVRRLVRDGAVDGLHLDAFPVGAAPCFNDAHAHATPYAAWGEGTVSLFRAVHDEGRKLNRRFFAWSGHLSDALGPYADYQRASLDPRVVRRSGAGPVEKGGDRAVEAFRYTFPEIAVTAEIDVRRGEGREEFDALNTLFALGLVAHFPGRTVDWSFDRVSPAFRAYYRGLQAARRQAKASLVFGRFRDDVGVEVSTPNAFAKAYTAPGETALVIVNRDTEEREIAVAVHPARLGLAPLSNYRLRELFTMKDIGMRRGADLATGIGVKVGGNRAAVVVIKKT